MNGISYEELWQSTWGDMQRFGPVHRHSLENLIRTVSKLDVRSILDVGCGSGENLAALASLGKYELAGTDIAETALDLARKRVPIARFRCLDVEREALTEKFDLVMSSQVVEHIVDDMAAFRNIARMATKYVLVATMKGRMRRSELAIGHIRNYSSIELRRKLEAVGLEVLDIHGWGFPFYSPLFRTLLEVFPERARTGTMSAAGRFAAQMLYALYKLNWSGRGDVVTAVARQKA